MTDTLSSTGAVVGHGPIRLRHREPRSGDAAAASAGSAATAAPGPVGHGTIRLRHATEAVAVQAPPPPPIVEAEPDAIGHGSIRLLHRTRDLPPDATLAAEGDILGVLTAAS